MQHQWLPFAKSLGLASALALGLSACVGGGTSSSSEQQAVSSQAISSMAPSSSSMAPSSVAISSSSIASYSSVMSSSSMPVASSSEAAADCSSLVAQGAAIYTKAGGLNCSTCHGAANGAMTSGMYKIDILGGLYQSDDGSSPELDTFIATYMSGYLPKIDIATEAEAVAAYLFDAAGANWCEDSAESSSSAPMSSSSEASSSSAPSSNDDFVVLYAVNAGGKSYPSADGIPFTGDYYFTGGNVGAADNINGTQDPEIFKSERWGTFTYNFPLKDGTYDVTFYVAETWFGAQGGAGNRVFDISAENNVIVSGFNPLDEVGTSEAYTFEKTGIQVSDGKLTLTFTGTVDEASIRGIVVRGLFGNKDEAPIEQGSVGDGPVPMGCTGNSTVTANDFVLFDGGDLGAMQGRTLELHGGWVLQEVWDANAKIELIKTGDGAAISYSNAPIYTGFKFAPPLIFGEPRLFSFDSIDVYVDYVTSAQSLSDKTFGIRVNYEREATPNGPGSSGLWTVGNGNAENAYGSSKTCSLINIKAPQNWDWNAQGNLGNKLIWEMKGSWGNSDTIRIRRMVFKGFKYAQ